MRKTMYVIAVVAFVFVGVQAYRVHRIAAEVQSMIDLNRWFEEEAIALLVSRRVASENPAAEGLMRDLRAMRRQKPTLHAVARAWGIQGRLDCRVVEPGVDMSRWDAR